MPRRDATNHQGLLANEACPRRGRHEHEAFDEIAGENGMLGGPLEKFEQGGIHWFRIDPSVEFGVMNMRYRPGPGNAVVHEQMTRLNIFRPVEGIKRDQAATKRAFSQLLPWQVNSERIQDTLQMDFGQLWSFFAKVQNASGIKTRQPQSLQ
ncbi:hypothetical protein BD779DRAFT_1472444 [Infundibulicybe gibba]|nr:hypothetical protein BD779DRAFT_1472444 [Infundibulicybe gibba]